MSLWSFDGQIGRARYAVLALGVFFAQHAAIAAIGQWAGQKRPFQWLTVAAPLHAIQALDQVAPRFCLGAVMIAAAWLLAALAFRRASDAQLPDWLAALAIVPIVQVPAILILCAAPTAAGDGTVHSDVGGVRQAWPAAAQGVVAGAALIVAAVALSALVFGAYGYGIFMASPFVVGLTTAYFANRKFDVGRSETVRLSLIATAIGGVALVVVALEGIVCIILAAPLAAAMAAFGAAVGHAMAERVHRRRQTLTAVAMLPLIFALESAQPPTNRFATEQIRVIEAPADRVWNAIASREPIAEPPAWPFRLGIAYPLFGEILEPRVGGIRRGVFSTGVAVERITEWEPNHRLSFTVTQDIPAMSELSPYAHVHAPHVTGYFRTLETRFLLRPISPTRTELIERTSHELNLNPLPYWRPLARIVVDLNNARVMRDIQMKAERTPASR